ncbi:MAG: type III pantothenate kinase [Cyclobacteriaceae bacterium]
MMNLIVDFGNSSAKAGIFEQKELLEVRDKLSLAQVGYLAEERDFDHIFISSVSESRTRISDAISGNLIFLDHTTPLPFRNDYKTPETLGLDRIGAVAGAQELFPNENVLVIDIGTCITYDVITSDGMYHGGAISPGIDMRFKAVHSFTANLPLVSYIENPALTGKSTIESIQSGVIFGIEGEIRGFVRMYADKYGDLKIILCGGGSKIFELRLKEAIFAAPDLVLRGLNRILRYNVA